MKLSRTDADVFVPDGAPMPAALERTTHLAIVAHQDDQEFIAYHGIAECFGRPDLWFSGVVVTNGGGSPRGGAYAGCSDADMMRIRRDEQRKAAFVGGYGCQIQLAHPSSDAKNPREKRVVADIMAVLEVARPGVVYLHNPADKHDTHVAVMARAIEALRMLPPAARPGRVLGCELWRSLDWLPDADKQILPVDAHPNLASALMGVYDSQISGGKRYDTAMSGRRASNATFFESHAVDRGGAFDWAMDLTPLVLDPGLDIADHAAGFVDRLKAEVTEKIRRMTEGV